MIIDEDAMCRQERSNNEAFYVSEPGKSCPTEILEALAAHNAEGRPIWKPMHVQPLYSSCPFVAKNSNEDVGADIFNRGLCLPSDNKMTVEEQDRIIDIVRECFE
jgi:dTDP-4-amino-4,6-dideoxygalactose transaminase